MNTALRLIRPAVLAVVFSLLFSLVASTAIADESELGEAVGTVAVPSGLSADEVKDAIVSALAGRQWGIKSKSDGRVVGYLKHRSNEATVTLVYDTSSIELYCVGWAINKRTGERKKPEQPRGWLKNIQADVTKILNRAITDK